MYKKLGLFVLGCVGLGGIFVFGFRYGRGYGTVGSLSKGDTTQNAIATLGEYDVLHDGRGGKEGTEKTSKDRINPFSVGQIILDPAHSQEVTISIRTGQKIALKGDVGAGNATIKPMQSYVRICKIVHRKESSLLGLIKELLKSTDDMMGDVLCEDKKTGQKITIASDDQKELVYVYIQADDTIVKMNYTVKNNRK